jgi:hypothetical protein
MLDQAELQNVAAAVMGTLRTQGAVKLHVTISAVVNGETGEMAMAQVWDGFSPLDAIALNTLHCDAVKDSTKARAGIPDTLASDNVANQLNG